jgi:hypothetical protein
MTTTANTFFDQYLWDSSEMAKQAEQITETASMMTEMEGMSLDEQSEMAAFLGIGDFVPAILARAKARFEAAQRLQEQWKDVANDLVGKALQTGLPQAVLAALENEGQLYVDPTDVKFDERKFIVGDDKITLGIELASMDAPGFLMQAGTDDGVVFTLACSKDAATGRYHWTPAPMILDDVTFFGTKPHMEAMLDTVAATCLRPDFDLAQRLNAARYQIG